MGTIKNDLEHPALAPYVGTIHDALLKECAEDYHAADERLRDLQSRQSAAEHEIAAIDQTMHDLSAPAMDKALSQRGRLTGLLAGLPTALAKARASVVRANLAYLAALRTIATSEAARLTAELAPIDEAAKQDRKTLDRAESHKLHRDLSEAEWDQEQAAFHARRVSRQETTQATRARLVLVQEAAAVIEIRAARFGDGVNLELPPTWDEAAAQIVRPLTAPIVRSLPHAY